MPCDQTLTEGFPPGASGPSEGGAGRTLLPQVGLLRGIPHVGPPQSRSLYWPMAGSWLEMRTKSAQKPGTTPGASSGAWPNPTAPLQELLRSGGCRRGRGRSAEEGARPECGRYGEWPLEGAEALRLWGRTCSLGDGVSPLRGGAQRGGVGYRRPVTLWRRRQRQPTPVLLPGKSHGRRSLVGCSPWGR